MKRDGFVDSMRGIFHIIMLIDHLPIVLASIFSSFMVFYEPLGFVSVAEGFVFLSGFVSGIVYTRVGREQGRRMVWRKALVRAKDILICYFVAVLALLILARWLGVDYLRWGSWGNLAEFSLLSAAAKVATLLYQPTFLEILPMYALFLMFTPIVLAQLEKGNYLETGAMSVLIWIAAQFHIRNVVLSLVPANTDAGFFDPFAWQILFVAGLVCGHKTQASTAPWLSRQRLLLTLAWALAAFLLLLRHRLIRLPITEAMTSRQFLGFVRLLNFATLTFLICSNRSVLERLVAWSGFGFLSRHSLQVFAFHLVPLCFARLALATRTSAPAWLQILVAVLCVVSLFQIAFFAKLWKDGLAYIAVKWNA